MEKGYLTRSRNRGRRTDVASSVELATPSLMYVLISGKPPPHHSTVDPTKSLSTRRRARIMDIAESPNWDQNRIRQTCLESVCRRRTYYSPHPSPDGSNSTRCGRSCSNCGLFSKCSSGRETVGKEARSLEKGTKGQCETRTRFSLFWRKFPC